MTGLTNQQMLDLWDQAPRTPTTRALAILAAASGRRRDELAALTIGCRDGLLIDVREATFGSSFDASVDCPRCGARLECVFRCSDIRTPSRAAAATASVLDLPDGLVDIRLPTSEDLEALDAAATADDAARMLAARCAMPHGTPRGSAATEMSAETAAAVATCMAALDPQAEIVMRFTCATCGESASTVFDIVEYLWMEIRSRAVRLIADVHDLARAYGWSEGAILALSDARRNAYLERLT
jgi:predicted RNA-binding Zn-ribbon protein involved in translation (DUF1610 family)